MPQLRGAPTSAANVLPSCDKPIGICTNGQKRRFRGALGGGWRVIGNGVGAIDAVGCTLSSCKKLSHFGAAPLLLSKAWETCLSMTLNRLAFFSHQPLASSGFTHSVVFKISDNALPIDACEKGTFP